MFLIALLWGSALGRSFASKADQNKELPLFFFLLSLPNMKAVCLCVWVWEQHYKYEFRISGSLSSTAIGCLFPPSPLVNVFGFFF